MEKSLLLTSKQLRLNARSRLMFEAQFAYLKISPLPSLDHVLLMSTAEKDLGYRIHHDSVMWDSQHTDGNTPEFSITN